MGIFGRGQKSQRGPGDPPVGQPSPQPSLSTPAPVTGPLSNDSRTSVNLKRTFRKLIPPVIQRKKSNLANTTGTIVAPPSNDSTSPEPSNDVFRFQALPSVVDFQVTTAASPPDDNLAGTSPGNTTSPMSLRWNNAPNTSAQHRLTSGTPNAQAQTVVTTYSPYRNDSEPITPVSRGKAPVILAIVKTISEMLKDVPYVRAAAGLAIAAIEISQEVDECKVEWAKVTIVLERVREMVSQFRLPDSDDSAPLPDDVKAEFVKLEKTLLSILESAKQYKDVHALRRMFQRGALKDEAVLCVSRINEAVNDFHVKISVGARLVGEQTHLVVQKIHLGIEKILSTQQGGQAPSSVLRLDVLPCPAPSQYFTGRAGILQKLSDILTVPVVTVFGANRDVLSNISRGFKNLPRFSAILLDASSVEVLLSGIENSITTKVDGANHLRSDTVLVLENTDVDALELVRYMLSSLQYPILITSTDQTVSRFTQPDFVFELPDPGNRQAADSLFRSIEKAFAPSQRVITLVAKGGTGKTQVVLKFVAENSSRFSNVWIFDATSDATLVFDFKKLGQAAGFGQSVTEVRNFLGRTCENWLLVFDNADNPNVDLNKYVPQCNHGTVIITSRLTEVGQMASPGCHLDITDLEQWEAIDLLMKRSRVVVSDNNHQLASEIVDTLGCQALAVATAGAYIASNVTCTLGDYLSIFRKKQRELLNYQMKSLDGYQLTVFSAFQLSFDQLSAPTQLFMQICAFYHHTAIPVELFQRAAAFTSDHTLPNEKPLALSELQHFLSLFPDSDSWNNSINELFHFSLVIYDTEARAISFHSVLHTCAQETIISGEWMDQVALLLLAHAASDGSTTNSDIDYQLCLQLTPHADCVYHNQHSTYHVYTSLANIFTYSGLWEKAEYLCEEIIACCMHYFSENHTDTITAKIHLAAVYRERGRLEEAETLGEEILEVYIEVLGEHHPHILKAMQSLALIYRARGKLEKAEVLGEKVLIANKSVFGEDHPLTLSSVGNLAITYRARGQLEKAEALGKEALENIRATLGEQHSLTIVSTADLAMTYQALGQLEEAQMYGEVALQNFRKKFQSKLHPNTVIAMANLAVIYQERGQLKEAEKLGREALELSEKVLGEFHSDTLRIMDNLAVIYKESGQLKEAEVLGKKAFMIYREVLGQLHPGTLITMIHLAMIYHACGKLKDAELLGKEALELSKQGLGNLHHHTMLAMANYAMICHACGQLGEAEIHGKQAVKLHKEVLGEKHHQTLLSMGNLALIYYTCGQLTEAEVLQEEVLITSKEVLGELHPLTLLAMGNIGTTYHAQGRIEEVLVLEENVLRLRREVLGELHPETLLSKANLAMTYHGKGRLEEAEVLGKEVLKARRIILGETHLETLQSIVQLALTYNKSGQLKNAELLRKEAYNMYRELLGDSHTETLASMASLAMTYCAQGQFDQAEILGVKALNLYRETLGESNSTTLKVMSDVATIYFTCGKLEEAVILGEKVVKLHKEVLGEAHPQTLISMTKLVEIHNVYGQLVQEAGV